MQKIFHSIICLSLLFFISGAAYAADLYGKVVAITDGDTLTILDANKKQIKIRLGEIDTPESGQPYGNKAKQELSNLAFGKEAKVTVIDTDRYGRTVGRLYVNGLDVNAEMIRRGAAWVYRQYNKDKSLLSIEAKAKQDKAGLWALPEAEQIPPWEWRRGNKGTPQALSNSNSNNNNSQNSINIPATSNKICGGKTKCSQMSNCEEARFYLNNCGLSRLDRDHDGNPCESLCR